MKLRCAVLLAILLLYWGVGCTKIRSTETKSEPVVFTSDSFVGVIFPAGSYVVGKTTSWTPTKTDVLDAEAQLKPFLDHAAGSNEEVRAILKRLKFYKRQYFGIQVRGEKELYINLFCAASNEHWKTQPVFVLDGGPCFFNLRFSPQTHTLSDLHINAQA